MGKDTYFLFFSRGRSLYWQRASSLVHLLQRAPPEHLALSSLHRSHAWLVLEREGISYDLLVQNEPLERV
jgi:hypothetical protein